MKFTGESSDQTSNHGNNPEQDLFAFVGRRFRELFLDDENIQTTRTLDDRSTRNVQIAATIRMRPFTVSFGYVENDARGRPIQLVAGGQSRRKCFNHRLDPGNKLQGFLIGSELFVIEYRRHCNERRTSKRTKNENDYSETATPLNTSSP